MSANLKMGKTEWALLLVLSVLWGGAFFFSKIALAEIPPFTLVFSRVLLAAGTLYAVIRMSGQKLNLSMPLIGVFFGMGVLNNLIPFSLIFYGQTQIASGLASILNATTPIFTVVVAHFLTTDERITAAKLVGILLGIVGVIIMLGKDMVGGFGLSGLAMLACLGAALSYAFAAVYGRRLRAMNVRPMVGAFGQVSASMVMMLPIMLLVDKPWTLDMPSVEIIWSVLALGSLCTALAYVLFFRILDKGGATNISLVTLLIPVSAIMLGVGFLNERLSGAQFGGMALIGLGLVVLDGRVFRHFKKPQTPQTRSIP